MKTLKITFALIAVLLLTVSGIQSDKVVVNDEPTYETKSNFDLLATNKKRLDKPTNG